MVMTTAIIVLDRLAEATADGFMRKCDDTGDKLKALRNRLQTYSEEVKSLVKEDYPGIRPALVILRALITRKGNRGKFLVESRPI